MDTMRYYFDDLRYLGSGNRRWFDSAEDAIDRAAYLSVTGLGSTRGVYAEDGTRVATSEEVWRVGGERYAEFADMAYWD